LILKVTGHLPVGSGGGEGPGKADYDDVPALDVVSQFNHFGRESRVKIHGRYLVADLGGVDEGRSGCAEREVGCDRGDEPHGERLC